MPFRRKGMTKRVLIAVIKTPSDLKAAKEKSWYRIPVEHAPLKPFTHIAFYQPASFGRDGKRIRFYAGVKGISVRPRKELIPGETSHPRAENPYLRYSLSGVRELRRPVLNACGGRVSFAYTTLKRLLTAKDTLELFDVPALERLLGEELKKRNVKFRPQHVITQYGKCRYRLDFAVFCPKGRLAIECDGEKWHSSPSRRKKDAARDRWLARRGWTMLRLSEKDIIGDMSRTAARITLAVKRLGWQ